MLLFEESIKKTEQHRFTLILKKTAIAILVAEPNCLFCNTPKIGKDMRPLNNKNESCGYVTTMEEVILGGSLVILSFRPFMEGLT